MIFSTVAPEIQSSNFDPTFLSKGDALKLKLLGYKQNEDATFSRTGAGEVGHGVLQLMGMIPGVGFDANLADWADERLAAGLMKNVNPEYASIAKRDANKELGNDMLRVGANTLAIATAGSGAPLGSGLLTSIGLPQIVKSNKQLDAAINGNVDTSQY